ncbi:hypothetical protein IR083_00010 [Dysgonomonas sp. GY75]|uniref:hypothetical protein n=1 Tax=Dysgonomonas sp. GY75 TaxID=2780419 RepID=UPI001884233F|nr:hypothetical protein [Dysgonomonas sp. GY75]MBF0647205.1 hypothetical protein [Dysgonomonas sp. GY75]
MGKLANKYKSESARYKLPNNAIYQYFGKDIEEIIFATVPDAGELNIKCKGDEIIHTPNEDETTFFEDQFIVFDKTNDQVEINPARLNIPADLTDKVGTMERKIFDFIYNGGHRLLLTGKKGWGKTTFLRYISRYLIPMFNKRKDSTDQPVFKPCLPVYISFNSEINSLNLAGEEEYPRLFYKIILDKIRNLRYECINSDIKGPFYQYLLEKDIFSAYRSEYNNIIHKHENAWITTDDREKELNTLRERLGKEEKVILYSFSYCNASTDCRAIPLIVLDDLDPLHTTVQTYLFTESYKLAHTYKIKVIVSMRPRSYDIVSRSIAEAIRINNQISFTDSFAKDYLKAKFSKMSERIAKSESISAGDGINIGGNLILKPLNVVLFFNNFKDISLSNSVLEFLKNISGGNLRKLNEFIKIYLKSGYIDASPSIICSLVEKHITAETSNNVPIWIVYSAIFTNNYETVFGMVFNEPDKFVVNILCNGTSSINTYLIRLHLLSFFSRNGSSSFTSTDILERYKEVVAKNYSDETIEKDISRALKRLNNYNLIGNNTILAIPEAENPDKISEKIDTTAAFYMEDLGHYYYRSIISIFEYFYFMKDDINFKDESGILSCIETKKNVILRFEQVIKYFEFLFEEEKAFYGALETPECRKHYFNNFAPFYHDGKIFFVQVFVEKMLGYARTRRYEGIQAIIDKLEILKDKIDETTKDF